MQRVSTLVFLLAVQVWSSSAYAASHESNGESKSGHSNQSSATSTESCSDAEAVFVEGERMYEAGELRRALEKFEECFAMCPSAKMLFDIALVQQQLGNCREALVYYSRYVDSAIDGEGYGYATQQIVALSKQCPVAEPEPESTRRDVPTPVAVPESTPHDPPVQPVASTPPRSHHWPTVGWIALGVGALTGVASATCAVDLTRVRREFENDGNRAAHDPAYFRDSICVGALGVTSGVSILLGAYALVLAAPRERAHAAALSITLSPNAALTTYRVAF